MTHKLTHGDTNRPLRIVSHIIVAMFIAVMAFATGIQGVFAPGLLEDKRNSRALYAAARMYRGPIVVGGEKIAYSEKHGSKYRRFYPEPQLYSAITGYFNNIYGKTGLERYLNSALSRQNPLGRVFGSDKNETEVVLTINKKLQKAAWQALEGYRGAIVALEPATGKILALVSRPSVDVNKLSNDSSEVDNYYKQLMNNPAKPLVNRATKLYHPGSIFKVITAAAALESGRYDLDKQIPDSNLLTFPGHKFFIKNSGACLGEIDLERALALSCNATFGKVAVDLGGEAIGEMARQFGFGKKFNVPMPFPASVYPVTDDPAQLAQSGFGQWDVVVTPMQVAMISSAIANGGKLMKPNIVQSITGPDGKVIEKFTPNLINQVANRRVVEKLSRAMESVVKYGTATRARIDGVRIAGKTGTAENGTGNNTLWFTGFAPVNKPTLAVSIVLEDQTGEAGAIAVPIARKVIQAALNGR